ncbi:2-amino-4-hydroxy-6-hydroxymethyldihydropteridine diphosphokinase [Pseudorhodobacter sp. W20_MBD10_FR17]|uniref:2-amino-4-hydroxy-6- hydroxymethyldihydropteridine diphosphokinase n=1 Tax=Pseudorhodobacter sp. W20_MBD10_FR17 TaxID=3240266 RepID=UPI003F993684
MLILVALGANLPSDVTSDRRSSAETLRAALDDLVGQGLSLVAESRFYRTPCFPKGAGPDYVNAAAVFGMGQSRSPEDILALLHHVEAQHGRTRQGRWASRTLDIDLLAVDDIVAPDAQTHQFWRDLPLSEQLTRTPDQLILPHPRLSERAFVLVPLADVAPDWRHPILGKTVVELRDALPQADLDAVQPLA